MLEALKSKASRMMSKLPLQTKINPRNSPKLIRLLKMDKKKFKLRFRFKAKPIKRIYLLRMNYEDLK